MATKSQSNSAICGNELDILIFNNKRIESGLELPSHWEESTEHDNEEQKEFELQYFAEEDDSVDKYDNESLRASSFGCVVTELPSDEENIDLFDQELLHIMQEEIANLTTEIMILKHKLQTVNRQVIELHRYILTHG